VTRGVGLIGNGLAIFGGLMAGSGYRVGSMASFALGLAFVVAGLGLSIMSSVNDYRQRQERQRVLSQATYRPGRRR
jgi:4-hydroxybenzoate polyprenyltransferase